MIFFVIFLLYALITVIFLISIALEIDDWTKRL